jgi:hypothetical protein
MTRDLASNLLDLSPMISIFDPITSNSSICWTMEME